MVIGDFDSAGPFESSQGFRGWTRLRLKRDDQPPRDVVAERGYFVRLPQRLEFRQLS